MRSASAQLSSAIALILSCTLSASCQPSTKKPGAIPDDPKGQWNLIWSEEFNSPVINTDRWNHQVFAGIHSGNRELQHYTDRPANSYIEDGKLVIKAVKEPYKDHDYTSARLTTQGHFSFKYGRVEARIKFPSTKGIWPAFWMMPEESVYGGWPHSGEIDIVESVNEADEIYGTIHYGNPNHVHQGNPYQLPSTDESPRLFSDDFHTYAVEWEPTEIRWYIDGELFSTQNEWMTENAPYPAPFDQEFHLILNVAVGGYWPGPPDETSTFPQKMEVDWIRVYQTNNEFPSVKFTSPKQKATVPGQQPVIFQAEAHDPDGTINRVDLVHGPKVIDTDSTAPYELTYENLPDGCYDDIAVVAFDNNGTSARDTIMIIVGEGCPQKPYGDKPISIPGTLEGEHFDQGWREDAYYDTDNANQGGQLRPDSDVDIGVIEDGTLYIGWAEPGEWMEYHVIVEETAQYSVDASIAAGTTGGTFSIIDTNNENNKTSIRVDPTGDWHVFHTITGKTPINLEKGETILRVYFQDGGVNIDKLTFNKIKP